MDQKTFRQTLRRAFWIPFGIAVVMAAILILEVRFLTQRAAWVEHTDQAITLSETIYRSRVDQETGLRAYVLTADRQFLEPFNRGRQRNLALEPELRRLIADNPAQIEMNDKAVVAFAAWSSWADKAIAMTQSGDAGNVTFQLQGKELMDRYRGLRQEFIERERQLRDQRIARSRRTLDFVNASIIASAILFALGFALLGRKQLSGLSRSFTAALNSAEERRDWLQTTLTGIGDAVIATDAEGHIVLMNPVAESLTEWPLKEAQGKPLSDVFRIVNQKTRQTVENPVDKVRRLNRVVGLANHTILLSRSGHEVAIDDSGAPIFGPDGVLTGIVLVFRDVTVQRAAEARLRERQTELETIVNRTPFMLTRCSRDLRYQFASQAYAHMLDRAPEDLVGRPVVEVMGEAGFNTIRPHIERVLSGERVEYEAEVSFQNVGIRSLHVIYTPDRDDQGNVAGWIASIVDVNERRKSQNALQQANARLSGLIASAMDAVIAVNDRQQIVMFNPAAEKIFGCSASDALGGPLDRFIPTRYRGAHRQHIENFGQTGVTSRTMSRPGTLWAVRNNGEEFPIEATISQVETGKQRLFTVILRDISERKQAEDALRREKERLTLALQASRMGVYEWNPVDRLAWWSPEIYAIHGVSPETFDPNNSAQLVHSDDLDKVMDIPVAIAEHRPWAQEYRIVRPDGEVRWVAGHAETEYDKDGRPLRCYGTLADITERKQIEETQRALEAALQSNERLALAGRLSASIAHEIHNPLDTVANVLFLLGRRLNRNREVQQLIETAQNELLRVTEISRNMLSLHRESHTASAVKLSELLRGVIALIEETIAKGRRNIELIAGFEGEVEAFSSELRQVFTNVIKNAVEATGEGGEIKIYTEPATETDQKGVLVRVTDDGVGIPEEIQSQLFNPFVSTKEESGTGLGLWVSRSILEKHGGSIRLHSGRDGQHPGTTVSIFLPLRMSPAKGTDRESRHSKTAAD